MEYGRHGLCEPSCFPDSSRKSDWRRRNSLRNTEDKRVHVILVSHTIDRYVKARSWSSAVRWNIEESPLSTQRRGKLVMVPIAGAGFLPNKASANCQFCVKVGVTNFAVHCGVTRVWSPAKEKTVMIPSLARRNLSSSRNMKSVKLHKEREVFVRLPRPKLEVVCKFIVIDHHVVA